MLLFLSTKYGHLQLLMLGSNKDYQEIYIFATLNPSRFDFIIEKLSMIAILKENPESS